MRKVLFQMFVTLDGYFEGPHREINWHNVDGEFNEYAAANLRAADTLLFGRVTYELMAGYWPTPEAGKDDPVIAERMNGLEKVVFSRTLKQASWEHTRIVRDDAAGEILRLKHLPGKNMLIFGSSDLAVSVIDRNVIDEVQLFINPVVLGGGKPLFQGIAGKMPLKLLDSKTFKSGNVLLTYHPIPRAVG